MMQSLVGQLGALAAADRSPAGVAVDQSFAEVVVGRSSAAGHNPAVVLLAAAGRQIAAAGQIAAEEDIDLGPVEAVDPAKRAVSDMFLLILQPSFVMNQVLVQGAHGHSHMMVQIVDTATALDRHTVDHKVVSRTEIHLEGLEMAECIADSGRMEAQVMNSLKDLEELGTEMVSSSKVVDLKEDMVVDIACPDSLGKAVQPC
jgi:hypothetical protein